MPDGLRVVELIRQRLAWQKITPHDNRETALAKTVLAINLEHIAVVRTKYWGPGCA